MQKMADAVELKEKWEQTYKEFTYNEEHFDAPSLEKYLGITTDTKNEQSNIFIGCWCKLWLQR